MNTIIKNKVLNDMAILLDEQRAFILAANQKDLIETEQTDKALYDRLKVDDKKIDGMILSLLETAAKRDPDGVERYRHITDENILVINKSAPFGTILIIYESRPDVTIEAAALAFKAGNKIILKGGKEAKNTNLVLINCWLQALDKYQMDSTYIQYLDFSREQTLEFLKHSEGKIDLIVPRGGDQLIAMVKKYSTAPVLVSGRGNNFIYLHDEADWDIAIPIIINAKTAKFSACNAVDKILIDQSLENWEEKIKILIDRLRELKIEIWIDPSIQESLKNKDLNLIMNESIWFEEFLSLKIVLALVSDINEAIEKINKYSGKHTAVIITKNDEAAQKFMDQIDAASVIQNASTRFTDGGQFGMGAELAISTEKLHHRGPLGLDQLVTNKWFVYGQGQIR